jgi:membrane protein implicated in regulation of membrane protease activity
MLRPLDLLRAPVQAGLIGPDALPVLLVAAGLGLSIAEAFIPGAHFIVVGLALLGAGLVGLAGVTLGLPLLASPFVLGLFVLLFGLLSYYGYRNLGLYEGTGESTLDSDTLRGASGRVTERVTPTSGEVKLDSGGFNPFYSARSVDGEIPEGAEVIVVDPGGGNVVTVESLDGGFDDIDRELARERRRREADRQREATRAQDREADGARDSGPGSGPDRDRDLDFDLDADTDVETE